MSPLRLPPPPVPARVARPGSGAWNAAKTGVQMVGFWSVFLWLLPTGIVRVERWLGWDVSWLSAPPWKFGGAALFAVASVLGVRSAWVMAVAGRGTPLPFDCPRRLVLRGPYRYVRNPMAIAGLSQGAAVGVMLGSWGVLAYTLAGFFVWNYVVRRWEEDDLHARFGAEYDAYRAEVRCWFPRRCGCDAAPPAAVD